MTDLLFTVSVYSVSWSYYARPMISGLRLALLPRFACGVVAMGKRKAQSKVYAVRLGRKVGVFSSWEACSQQVGSSALLAAQRAMPVIHYHSAKQLQALQ